MLGTLLLSWYPWSGDGDEDEDAEEPVDPTDRELRIEAYKQQKKIDKMDDQVQNHQKKYQKYLEKGANATQSKRQLLALRARMEKFKGQLRQLELKKATRDLLQLEVKRGENEIREIAKEVTEESDALADNIEINVDNFSEMAEEAEAEIHVDMEKTQEAMQAMQAPNADFNSGHTEEEQIMEEIAKGEASPEQYDLGDVDITDDDMEGGDVDWDDDEFEQGF